MRKISGLVVVLGAVLLPLSLAHAATEVIRLPANNAFASFFGTDAAGDDVAIFVSRQKTSGGVTDMVFISVSRPDGTFSGAAGTLPTGAFHVSAKSASLDVDINDLDVFGDVPADGEVHVAWAGTDVQRTSGSTQFDFGNQHAVISGTRTDIISKVTGSVFGVALVPGIGSMSTLVNQLMIITRN